ncbi:hypothetical protein GQX74_006925 [Glossina fuscipes]|nr:hypothetical protein GQX74_006925 [Glossina fuscipes]
MLKKLYILDDDICSSLDCLAPIISGTIVLGGIRAWYSASAVEKNFLVALLLAKPRIEYRVGFIAVFIVVAHFRGRYNRRYRYSHHNSYKTDNSNTIVTASGIVVFISSIQCSVVACIDYYKKILCVLSC